MSLMLLPKVDFQVLHSLVVFIAMDKVSHVLFQFLIICDHYSFAQKVLLHWPSSTLLDHSFGPTISYSRGYGVQL